MNLLPGSAVPHTADTPAMVSARRNVFSAGHFGRLTAAVAAAVGESAPRDTDGIVVDAGGGTGEYLSAVLDHLPDTCGLSIDVSKHAARWASRIHPRGSAIVADVWSHLPVADEAACAVLSVFAPKNAEEFARILSPEGALIVVTPTQQHLAQLIEPLELLRVDPSKRDRLTTKLNPQFERKSASVVEYTIELDRQEAVLVAAMGPAAAHASHDALSDRAGLLAELSPVTISVNIERFVLRS